MKNEKKNFEGLAHAIADVNDIFLRKVQQQVNTAFTLRNWIIGYRIFEYEQSGEDRAQYGEKIFKKLAERLKSMGAKGFSFTNLHLYKQVYLAYLKLFRHCLNKFNWRIHAGK